MASWLAFRFLTMRSQAPVCISCAVMPLIHYMTSLMHRVNDPCVKLYDCCHLVLEACMHKVLDSDVGMFPINKQDLPSMIQSAQVTSPHPLVQMTSESLPPQGYAAPAPGAYPAPPPGAHPAPPPGAYPAPPPGAYMQPPPGAYPVPPAGYPGGPPVEYAAPAAYPVQYVQPQGVMVQAKAPLPGRWQHGICDCCADPGGELYVVLKYLPRRFTGLEPLMSDNNPRAGCGQCCMTFCCPCITVSGSLFLPQWFGLVLVRSRFQ